ncbi:MAG TPA: AraC family transcriptional regulator [Sphingobacteriaceae bacterium]
MNDSQTLALKGMVCNRCITVLKSSLEGLSLSVLDISLGRVTVAGLTKLDSPARLSSLITSLNFQIIESADKRRIADMKCAIGEWLDKRADDKVKISAFLAERFNQNYSSLSMLFSKLEGASLESYIIQERVSRVKSYLKKTNLSLTEIAYLTGYSSVFHLSSQFKATTTMTPTEYRKTLSSFGEATVN